MADEVEYEVPSCNQIYQMLLCQSQKIQSYPYKPDIVVGIARGGIIPARFLADFLDIKQFDTLQIEFYLDIAQTKAEPTLKHALTSPVADKAVLLVDDIADTGKTLKLAAAHVAQLGATAVKTAALYHKPQSIVTPDFYEKQTCRWVVFPWDLKETLRKIMQRKAGKRQVNGEIAKLVKAGLPKALLDKLIRDMQ